MDKHTQESVMGRRAFLQWNAAIGTGALVGNLWAVENKSSSRLRKFHASLSMHALEENPDLLPTVVNAGIDAIWVAAFLQGSWQYPPEVVTQWKKRIENAGAAMHHITVPLGHPSFDESVPDYVGASSYLPWQAGVRPDGRRYRGVCIHPPAAEINAEAVKTLYAAAAGTIFLDDDFRLAPSPNDVGGCFCEQHRAAFLKKHGYNDNNWDELIDNVQQRSLTSLVRAWLEDACDELTSCFRAQQQAVPEKCLGIMIMYLGSEKAGIRLSDYREAPVRVGELMFNDQSFAPVKGKTDELFSALFHRRFVSPENAYSETTAWPPDGLSARNIAAKLAVSTIADVRNTMFMSGITPYPLSYWDTLAPAMKLHAPMHEQIAGHTPRGPFKHYWGEHSRWVGNANPFSLFLATGIPFEISGDEIAEDGFTFLADADALAVSEGKIKTKGSQLVCRDALGTSENGATPMPESLDALFALKHQLLPNLHNAPYVLEDAPVVCAWYPTARTVALWNLSENQRQLTTVYNGKQHVANAAALGMTLITEIG